MHKNNIYLFFQNLFLTPAHQNDLKTLKKINLKQNKILNFNKK
jgi:hypothetical protein